MHRRTLTQEADARAISAFLICLDDTLSCSVVDEGIPSLPQTSSIKLPVKLPSAATRTASHPVRQQPSHQTSLATAQKTTTPATQSTPNLLHPQPSAPSATPALTAEPVAVAAAAQQPQPQPQSHSPSSSRSRSFSHPAPPHPKAKASTLRASLLGLTTTTIPLSHHHQHQHPEKAVSQPWASPGEDARLASTLAWACLLAVEADPRHAAFLSAYDDAATATAVKVQRCVEETEEVEMEAAPVVMAAANSITGLRKSSMPAMMIGGGRRVSMGMGGKRKNLRSVFSGDFSSSSLSSVSSLSTSLSSSPPPASYSSTATYSPIIPSSPMSWNWNWSSNLNLNLSLSPLVEHDGGIEKSVAVH